MKSMDLKRNNAKYDYIIIYIPVCASQYTNTASVVKEIWHKVQCTIIDALFLAANSPISWPMRYIIGWFWTGAYWKSKQNKY